LATPTLHRDYVIDDVTDDVINDDVSDDVGNDNVTEDVKSVPNMQIRFGWAGQRTEVKWRKYVHGVANPADRGRLENRTKRDPGGHVTARMI